MVGSVSEWDIHVVIERYASWAWAGVAAARPWLLLQRLVGQHVDDLAELLGLCLALQDFAGHEFGIGLEHGKRRLTPASFTSLKAILHLGVFFTTQQQANALAHQLREAWRRHDNFLVVVPFLDLHLRYAELSCTQTGHHGVH